MKKILEKPVLVAVLVAVILFGVASLVTIPMFDATLTYDKSLVHIQLEDKIALRNLWGAGMEQHTLDGLVPRVALKPIGWVLFILVHLGLPALIGLRFYYAKNNRKTA
jgi:hypothetical protein